jgi:hypothetical protein
MNYEKIITTMAVLTFIFTAGLSAEQAKASQDETVSQDIIARAEIVLESLEEADFENWSKRVSVKKLPVKVNKDDFQLFIKARKLARNGEYEASMAICAELKSRLKLSDREFNQIAQKLPV